MYLLCKLGSRDTRVASKDIALLFKEEKACVVNENYNAKKCLYGVFAHWCLF